MPESESTSSRNGTPPFPRLPAWVRFLSPSARRFEDASKAECEQLRIALFDKGLDETAYRQGKREGAMAMKELIETCLRQLRQDHLLPLLNQAMQRHFKEARDGVDRSDA